MSARERSLTDRIDANTAAFIITANLEKVRKDLATQHANNVRETEKERSVIQKERQAVFQDAFQNDMNCYKTTGSIPSETECPIQCPNFQYGRIIIFVI